MGYSIYIGNSAMRRVDDDEEITEYPRVINGKTVYFEPHVPGMSLPDAPTFPNDRILGHFDENDKKVTRSNGCHPSYTFWAWFLNDSGLTELFFDGSTGLMRNHPGYVMLLPLHAQAITTALKCWQCAHIGSIPGFEQGCDPVKALLIWLDWWTNWAVEHCEHAGIYNS